MATRRLFQRVRPDVVVHAAAKVGGIRANASQQSAFLLENLAVDSAVFGAALDQGIQNLLYLGSSCTYPRDHRQPLVVEDLMAGPLEPSNEGYALAKLAGTRLCEHASREHGVNYRALLLSNLYGPDDDFDTTTGHLVASALAKVHHAAQAGSPVVSVWGDGSARREFTFADDVAGFMVSLLSNLQGLPPVMNVGAGQDHSVDDFYRTAAMVVGYTGEFVHDVDQPTGMQRKLMDSSVARELGWIPSTDLLTGMTTTYQSFLRSEGEAA